MRISLRRGFSAPPEVVECSWGELIHFLQSGAGAAYSRKEDVPLILFGATTRHQTLHEATTSGWTEADQDPEGLWCAAFDFDDVTPEGFARALEVAKNLGAGFAHTTWQHGITPGVVRARIVLQCAEPVPLGSWPLLWAALAARFEYNGCVVDQQCKNANRCWYVPARNPASPLQNDGAWFESWQIGDE